MECQLNRIIDFIKSAECRIFLHYLCFWIVFLFCFVIMFAMLFTAVIGVTFGIIMTVFGAGVLLFNADFIISGIAPEIMLFGGLTAVFFSGFLGMAAVKIGFLVSRYFLRTRRHCDNLNEFELSSFEEYEEIENTENDISTQEE